MFAKLLALSVVALGVSAQLTTTSTTAPPTTTVSPTTTSAPTTTDFPTVTSDTTATSTSTPPPAVCARQYTVKSGDTCNAISAAQSVSTFQLAITNPVINAGCTNLFVGQVLCLGLVGQDCTTTHVVTDGEFCFSIAEAAGVDLTVFLTNNRNLDSNCSNLGVGDVVCTSPFLIPYTFQTPSRR